MQVVDVNETAYSEEVSKRFINAKSFTFWLRFKIAKYKHTNNSKPHKKHSHYEEYYKQLQSSSKDLEYKSLQRRKKTNSTR